MKKEKPIRFHKLISQFRDKLSQSLESKITEVEIEIFYNKLNGFDFRRSLFSNYYQNYIANLNRLRPEADNEVDRALLLVALKENRWKPTKPFDIFLYHIKYTYKLTSKPFLAFQKRKQRKKLNSPEMSLKIQTKQQSSKEWTRVPLSQTDKMV